jgi:hypothetical protein
MLKSISDVFSSISKTNDESESANSANVNQLDAEFDKNIKNNGKEKENVERMTGNWKVNCHCKCMFFYRFRSTVFEFSLRLRL